MTRSEVVAQMNAEVRERREAIIRSTSTRFTTTCGHSNAVIVDANGFYRCGDCARRAARSIR